MTATQPGVIDGRPLAHAVPDDGAVPRKRVVYIVSTLDQLGWVNHDVMGS